MEDEHWESIKADLIEDGSIEEIFVDEEGETRIKFNKELLEILHPTIAKIAEEAVMDEVNEALSSLVDKGFLTMSFKVNDDGSMEAVYSVSPKGAEFVESHGLTDQA